MKSSIINKCETLLDKKNKKKTTKLTNSKDKIVNLDLDNNTLLWLALEAHKKDIKLNQMIIEILQNFMDETKDMSKEEVAKLLKI